MEARIKKDKSKQTAKYNARIRSRTLQANAIAERHEAKRALKRATRADIMEEPAVVPGSAQ